MLGSTASIGYCVLPQVLLANIAAGPSCALEELSIMHPDERTAVMRNTFSPLQLGAAVGAFACQTIHGMLEHWVATTSDAPAATFQVGLHTAGLCIQVHVWLLKNIFCQKDVWQKQT